MELSAHLGRLRYINDDTPGFGRKPHPKGFRYLDVNGKALKDPQHLARIKSLAIPPAWTNVWICPYSNGHLQATGRDAKQRKQYRYHSQWRKVRDEVKYEHMIDFGLHLPIIRKTIHEQLSKPGLTRQKILATIIYLLEHTMIRIGNDEYAKSNQSFGLTTLRNRHVEISGNDVYFHFRGKSKIVHKISLYDPRMARIIKRMMDLPGQELFQYVDKEGVRHSVDSADVNEYLQQITRRNFTAKDFRTWSGTLQTAIALIELERFNSIAQAKKNVTHAIECAAKKLGNTPSICKKCYVHPVIIEHYMAGDTFDIIKNDPKPADNKPINEYELNDIEQYILNLLQSKLKSA